MKYYIIAGEASGDLHGSNLIKELRNLDVQSTIRCWGGDLMQQAGADLVKHYKDLAFMGFTEVITNLPTIFKNLRYCKEDIAGFQPDTLILIDYPGFNLRIASWAKKTGLRVIYYISPQVWAWKENRVKSIRKSVDKMLVILPFEKEFYKKWDIEVEYVGHPLVEEIENYKRQPLRPIRSEGNQGQFDNKKHQPIIALLPGSRKQEILKKLPVMLEMSRLQPAYHFIVALAPGVETSFYKDLLQAYPEVSAIRGETYNLLRHATAACVTSGTATLETALFGVPEVVCYKGSHISYQIAKRLIKVKYISLVNLIMDKPVVKELIQNDFTIQNLDKELTAVLTNDTQIRLLKADYEQLKTILTKGGHASANAARFIYNWLISSVFL